MPFSLVIGDYEFDQSVQSVAVLAKIAGLMHEAGLPFVAGASAKIAGFESFAKFPDSGQWQPRRRTWRSGKKIRAQQIGGACWGWLRLRFLLRLPYGPKTDAIDTYPFDEMPGVPVTEMVPMWVNGAFAVALQRSGRGFWKAGGRFEPVLDVADSAVPRMAVVDGDKGK